MADPLQFELVSPEKLVLSKPVAMVTVPGGEGDFGVLPGHAPMITTVRPGVIAVYEANDTTVTERIFVAGGFAEVSEGRCTVLAEEVVPVDRLNRAELDQKEKDLAEGVALARTDEERAEAEALLGIARAKLQALTAVA